MEEVIEQFEVELSKAQEYALKAKEANDLDLMLKLIKKANEAHSKCRKLRNKIAINFKR